MKVAIIGVKYLNKRKIVLEKIKDILIKNRIDVDFSYFDTSAEVDSQDLEKSYKNLNAILKRADVVIAEITDYSLGVGYLMAQTVIERKPVLALRSQSSENKSSNVLKSNAKRSKYLKYEDYNEENLESVILKFVENTKSILDTKFILIISPEIDRYLQWEADQKRMHKAQIVRNAVEKMMDNDQEWKEYQKEINN